MKPRLTQVLPDPTALYGHAASIFRAAAVEAVRRKGFFTVALSGGSTPRSVYSLLASEPVYRNEIPWSDCRFFWGDERHVAPGHTDSNFRMATEAMLSRLPVQPAQIFRIRAEECDASEAAREYDQRLCGFFKLGPEEFPRFDLVFLGMGPDGHTASLFPGTDALKETRRLVVENWIGKFGASRITMTVPVFNNALQVVFLVSGEDKALALKSVIEGPYAPRLLPAQLIQPHHGSLLWLVDKAAAGFLRRDELQEAN